MSAYGRLQNVAWDWEGPGEPCDENDQIEEWVVVTLFQLRKDLQVMKGQRDYENRRKIEVMGAFDELKQSASDVKRHFTLYVEEAEIREARLKAELEKVMLAFEKLRVESGLLIPPFTSP